MLYATLLKTTAAAIHDVDPDADVILGGMFGKRATPRLDRTTRYLRDLYRVPGIEESFDGVAIHPYDPTAQGVFDSVDDALAVIRRAGDDAGLWITEIGWASSGKRSENLVKDPELQARLLRRVFSRFLHRATRGGCGGVLVRDARHTAVARRSACGAPEQACSRSPTSRKPSYYALKRVMRGR